MIASFLSQTRGFLIALTFTALPAVAQKTAPADGEVIAPSPQHISSESSNGLAATVNGRPITRSEVDESLKNQLHQINAQVSDPAKAAKLKAELRKEALDALIDRELILDEYEKVSGGQAVKPQYVDEDIKDFVRTTYSGDYDKFIKELKSYGMTLKKFRAVREKMLKVQMMRSHASKDVSIATPAQKEQFLKEHSDLFREKDYIKLRSITVSKLGSDVSTTPESQKRLITEIRQRVLKGADFASEAKTYSIDSHASGGGDWGTIDRTAMSGKMADAAFKLSAKSVGEIIEDNDNYYLFYVEAKQPGKMKPMGEIETDLEKMVQLEARKKLYEAWISRIRAKANIKKF